MEVKSRYGLSTTYERSEEELVDVRKELQYYKEELAQSQRENQQLKQQIYNLQHPQQAWDEPER